MVKLALCCLCKMFHELVYIIVYHQYYIILYYITNIITNIILVYILLAECSSFMSRLVTSRRLCVLKNVRMKNSFREICNTMHLDKDGIVRIQLYDDEFCDWVDLADTDYIPEKADCKFLFATKVVCHFRNQPKKTNNCVL